MNGRSNLSGWRKVAGGLLLALPLAGFAAPPMGADHGDGMPGMGPHDGPGCMMHEHGFGPPGMHHGPGMMGGDLRPRFLHGLRLSEEQEDKVFAILHAAAPAAREQMKAMHKAHEALHGLEMSDKFDEAKVRSLVDNASKAHGQLMLQRLKTEHDVWAVLTPEQRAQVEEHKHHWEGHGHHDEDGHGG